MVDCIDLFKPGFPKDHIESLVDFEDLEPAGCTDFPYLYCSLPTADQLDLLVVGHTDSDH